MNALAGSSAKFTAALLRRDLGLVYEVLPVGGFSADLVQVVVAEKLFDLGRSGCPGSHLGSPRVLVGDGMRAVAGPDLPAYRGGPAAKNDDLLSARHSCELFRNHQEGAEADCEQLR